MACWHHSHWCKWRMSYSHAPFFYILAKKPFDKKVGVTRLTWPLTLILESSECREWDENVYFALQNVENWFCSYIRRKMKKLLFSIVEISIQQQSYAKRKCTIFFPKWLQNFFKNAALMFHINSPFIHGYLDRLPFGIRLQNSLSH